ncbi:MAG: DUF4124 domain-containing protein, partial [Gammaproteobacteria bacterium]|nr:DUF4124 domain-containing protein [Gammaproteobacteria bacterium]
MRFVLITFGCFLLVSLAATAAETQKLYRWVDADGIVHYGDSIPAEYADIERQVVNDHGITVDIMRGKKSEEEIAEEKRLEELRVQRELQRRADIALLATYLSIDEIIMHRDRRVELFQAQARVTELYLRNLQRRLAELEADASKYRPYSEDENAPMIDPSLVKELTTTKEAIARHQRNLQKFQDDEQSIVARFDGDI